MTSLLGFEALAARPAGHLPRHALLCGLGPDARPCPRSRTGATARSACAALAHAALIAYPRYRDPVSGLPCPAEVVVERLATGAVGRPGAANRMLSKVQGLLASRAALWR